MRVTLAQLDATIGDIDHNAEAILAAVERASRDGADLLVTPELALIGYPPRDLLLRHGVAERCRQALDRIAATCLHTTALIGFPEACPGGPRPFRNAVAVCRQGRVEGVYAKRLLPTYDVFDEDRYFTPGDRPLIVGVAGERVGILVCEDLWRSDDAGGLRSFRGDPVTETLVHGATALAVLSASPFVTGKDARHSARLSDIARRGTPLIAVNQVGGNDDLIFDGRSRALARGGTLRGRLAAFVPDTRTIDLGSAAATGNAGAEAPVSREEELIEALIAGIRGYLRKTGHRSALLGLSGGIDSALVAALAAIALGGEEVTGVLLPSRYSSDHSVEDALESARRLRLRAAPTVSIAAAHAALQQTLGEVIAGGVRGVVDENLQSRLRGMLLMAISNAEGSIVLSTGNKSELAVGYATLYGDMCGGLAPLGDIPKSTVFALARWLNEHAGRYGCKEPPIPERSIDKPPSAELRPDQTDQDSLPPYDVLDAIIEGWIDREEGSDQIAARTGLDAALVAHWCRIIDRMQYKRDQAAQILKVSPRAFGRGRPMPIAANWRPGEI